MRRLFYCIPIILALLLCSCAKPYNSSEPSAADNIYVVELAHQDKDSILVMTESGLCTIDSKDIPSDLHSGAKLEVTCDSILESYPGQFANASVKVISDGDGLLDLYYSAFSDLMKTDPALCEDISEIALDFDASSLSKEQKEALGYLLSNLYGTGMSYSFSDYQKLNEEGRIKNHAYENGVILSLKSEQKGSTLYYSYSEFRSGTAATGIDDCKAEKKNGVWQNILSNETMTWIS